MVSLESFVGLAHDDDANIVWFPAPLPSIRDYDTRTG